MFEESSSQINIKVKTNNLVNEIKNPINNNKQDVDLFLNNWKKRKINKIKFSNFEILKLYLCNCKCVINLFSYLSSISFLSCCKNNNK